MKPQHNCIVMPWHANELGSTLIRRVCEAADFARWLGSELHILISPRPDASEVARIQSKLNSLLPRDRSLMIETDTEEPATATLAAIQRKDIGLVLVIAEPGKTHLSAWQSELVEQLHVPVILVPATAKLDPLQSILVPLQGEYPGEDSGLDYGLQLASRFDLPLDILHVTPKAGDDPSMVGEVGDSLYHEYPNRMTEMIVGASPLSSDRDRSVIRKFLHVRGDTAEEIVSRLARYSRGLIALQWKGSFAPGRAATIKAVLRASPCPILLVRRSTAQSSTLDLGNTRLAS